MSIDILVVGGCLLALAPVLFIAVLGLAACMRSSQISRMEEKLDREVIADRLAMLELTPLNR